MDPILVDQCGDVSVARWEPKLGLAEVLVKRGKLWSSMGVTRSSMGVTRSSKLYFHVEEAIYMVEQKSLILLLEDTPIPRRDVYSLLTVPKNGCSWDAFQVFCHLKRLGYIVGRHNVAWSSSSQQKRQQPQILDKPIEELISANLVPESTSEGQGGPSSRLPTDEKRTSVSPDIMTRCNQENSERRRCSNVELKEDILRPEERDIHGRVKGIEEGEGSDPVVSLEEGEGDEACATLRKGDRLRDEDGEGLSTISLNLAQEEDSGKDEATKVGPTADIDNLSSVLSALEVNDDSSDNYIRRSSQESDCSLMFDVHHPNSRFKKTDPGTPAFSLCIVGGQPLEQKQVRDLERKAADRPLKFGSVVGGHVFIYSFTSCELPSLP